MQKFLNLMQIVNKGMDLIAATVLVLIMLLTSLDVVLRYLGHPIQGSYDLVTFGAAFVIGFALPRTSWDHMHITVDILVENIPAKKAVLDVITRILSISLFVLIGWNFIKLGASLLKTGESTLTLGVPLYPIAYALGISAFFECLALFGDIVRIGLQRRAQ
jgi:TRAP-type C4-dicarboxylate transport system permease small subunit